MNKKITPESTVHAIRIPIQTLERLRALANDQYRSLNDQMLMFLEDGLVKAGRLKESERRKRKYGNNPSE
ncbi:Arc family DNA-binding protein [Candidatus Neomarinimicrobiota bacterium]